MPCSPVGLSNASRNSFILYGFPQPVPAEVLKGQSLRDRELRWLGSGHLRLQSKAREKGKARQSSFHICPPPACCAAPGWPHHTDHRTGNLFAGKRCSERLQAFLRGHIFGWLFACWPRKQVNARAPTILEARSARCLRLGIPSTSNARRPFSFSLSCKDTGREQGPKIWTAPPFRPWP